MNSPLNKVWLRRRIGWALVALLAGAFLLLILGGERKTASKPGKLSIRISTNGLPTILGISLRQSRVRDVILRSLGKAKVPTTVVIAPCSLTGPGSFTNLLQTFNALTKAGLLVRTNSQSGPSPFE